MAISSFLAGLGIAAAIGAGIGALSYTAGQIIDYAFTGDFEWSWIALLNNSIGGAIGGTVVYCFAGSVGTGSGAFISGFAANAATMVMENFTVNANHSFSNIFISSLISGALSSLSAGIMDKIKIPKINYGRGSFTSISKQMYTKFHRGIIRKITIKTFGKMFIAEVYGNIAGVFVDYAYSQTAIICDHILISN